MKKLIYGCLFLALVGIGIVGCEKKNIQKQTLQVESSDSDFNISSDGRMLIFKTTEDYKKVVNNPTDEIKKKFLSNVSKMNHSTFLEKVIKEKTEDLIDDDFFESIINEDAVVQIGEYLYKINPITEKVFVLPASKITEYDDLVNENKENINIRQFSTSDYVIDLAESGDAGEKGLFCGESGCGYQKQETDKVTIPGFGGQYKFEGYSRYLRLGVYFCLKADASSNSSNIRIYIQYENSWDKVKCGSTHGATNHLWYQNNSTYSTDQDYRKYQGIQPLNGLHLKARVRCEVSTGGGNYETYFTSWAEIEANSPY